MARYLWNYVKKLNEQLRFTVKYFDWWNSISTLEKHENFYTNQGHEDGLQTSEKNMADETNFKKKLKHTFSIILFGSLFTPSLLSFMFSSTFQKNCIRYVLSLKCLLAFLLIFIYNFFSLLFLPFILSYILLPLFTCYYYDRFF